MFITYTVVFKDIYTRLEPIAAHGTSSKALQRASKPLTRAMVAGGFPKVNTASSSWLPMAVRWKKATKTIHSNKKVTE